MKPSEILRKGAELYRSGEIGHCKGSYARRADGTIGIPDHKDTVKCCAIGMVMRLNAHDSLLPLLSRVTLEPVIEWNDRPETTVADVIALFEKAAALAESEGQ